jgi:hypothetical protein
LASGVPKRQFSPRPLPAGAKTNFTLM